jgi:CRISPR/Cas system-associated exonuclease Cas4 (RecB family)
MYPFLKAVAEDVYHKFGDNLSRTAIVFPGKRAGLFFNQYLVECAGHPLWAPAYITISDLFGQLSTLKVENPIRQVCLLHKIFNQHTLRNEPLDDFFYWGELMLSDFDDIDKNLVEADDLFINLADVKTINSRFEFLTEEQKNVLERFFSGFRDQQQRTALKDRFIELWRVMGTIYKELHTQLHTNGMAYEGMMYRDAIEHFDSERLTFDRYIIVGFNVLNKVEQELFTKLKENGRALFYWDYDLYYYNNPHHEAGTFVRENISKYGNALADVSIYDNLKRLPEISYIAAPTDNAQARYLSEWIHAHHTTSNEQETAIVLCNEDMALPVLHALPSDKVNNVNITMGFKLTQTPVYSLINSYLTLHTRGFDEEKQLYKTKELRLLLTHPYINALYPESKEWWEEILKSNRLFLPADQLSSHPSLGFLFVHHSSDNAAMLDTISQLIERISHLFASNSTDEPQQTHELYTQLYEEALFRIHQFVSSFRTLLDENTLNVKPRTLVRLIQRAMKQATIPFHGEPAIGLQVMGVLETRNLDFKRIILLSTNEGKLPKKSNEASFIPYNLREAFGMTTLQRQNAVYAYYFYRMIQRAEHVTIVYNDGTDGMNKQEPSRYVMQLQVEFPGTLTSYSLQATTHPTQHTGISIEQTDYTRQKLQEHFRYDPTRRRNYKLSPSAINDYLTCRLKFYLQHIEGLTPPEELKADVDVAHFGSIFHKSAELAYEKLTERGNMIHDFELEALYNQEEQLSHFVDEAFRLEFFHTDKGEPLPFNGTQLIVRHAIKRYLRQLLKMDAQRAPFQYIKSEMKIQQTIIVQSHGTELPILLGGTIDRIDCKEGITRIIDYKTGGSQKKIDDICQLFHTDKPRDNYVFQAFYYAYLMKDQYEQIAPSLLFVRNTSKADFEPNIIINKNPVTNFKEYSDEFGTLLNNTIEEIFNSDLPYTAAENNDACLYCQLKSICRRKVENFYR